jgi:hypothetical protein
MGNSGEIRRRLFWLVLACRRRGGRRRIFRVNTDVVGIRGGRFQPRGGREYAAVALLGQHRTAPRFSPEEEEWWSGRRCDFPYNFLKISGDKLLFIMKSIR